MATPNVSGTDQPDSDFLHEKSFGVGKKNGTE